MRAANSEKDAANARLETERLRAQVAWRRVSLEQHAKLVEALSTHCFSMYFEFSQADPEATQFAEDIFKSLKAIPGINVYPPHPLTVPPAPSGVTVSGAESSDRTALESALLKAGIKYRTSNDIAGEPRLSVGSRPTPF